MLSDSTRPSAYATSAGTGSCPRRDSSAYPRIEASGVRSSWLASATNWRTRVSLSCRAVSAAETCPSIRLSAAPTWPTSVRGSVSASGTRSDSSTVPRSSGSSETLVAVAATRRSGRRVSRTISAPAMPASSRPPAATAAMITASRVTVSCTPDSGSPATETSPSGVRTARSR